MRLRIFLTFGAILLVLKSSACAQATTVQLPTISNFTVQTTVSVPDRGAAYLGGISRGADGRVARGISPLANKAIGGTRSASNVSVSATIIDNAEIDRSLLAAAAARRGETVDPAVAKAAGLSSSVARTTSSAAPESVATIRERTAAAAELETAELASYFAKAKQAEADGKPVVAKVFYQMVARRDKGELKQQALARLAALSTYRPWDSAAR